MFARLLNKIMSLPRPWLLGTLFPAVIAIAIGCLLIAGAMNHPQMSVSSDSSLCKQEWFTDLSPGRTVQLERYANKFGDTEPALHFCLGLHKLKGKNTESALMEIGRAAESGYAPAAEWLALAYRLEYVVPRSNEKSRGWFLYADRYGGQVAREIIYTFGIGGLSRPVAYTLGLIISIGAFAAICKRTNGFDLRLLGPMLLFCAISGSAALRRDQLFLAEDGSLESIITFIIAALGANLSAAAIRHDPSHPST